MSHLRVFRPELSTAADLAGHDSRRDEVFPFELLSGRFRRMRNGDTLERARLLYRNRFCPRCRRPVVEPLDLHDALRNRNGMPIPGTSTLVGFFCQGCDAEWTI